MPIERAPRIVVMLLAGLLIAGHAGRGFGEPADLDGRRIVSIDFVCAAVIDREDLLRLLPMHVGDDLRADAIEAARGRLQATDVFTDVSIDTTPRDDGVALVVRLVRKTVVNRIWFRGNHALSDDELQRVIRLYEGGEVTDKLREYAVKRIQERYVKEGFAEAQATVEVRPRIPGEVDIAVRIDEGDPLRVRAIEIDGAGPLPIDDVRKATGISVGDRFVRAQLRKSQAAIVRLYRDKQYYEVEVSSHWERGDGRSGSVRFTVTPGPLFVITFSGNHRFKDKYLLGLMDLPGRPIVTDGTWRELGRRAERAYQEAGDYFARVNLRLVPGTPKSVRFDVTEDAVFHVGEVGFEGNHGLSGGLLRAQMATRPPSWIPWRHGVFLDDVFDDDLKRLWYFYRRYGFEDAQIVDDRTNFDRESGKVAVTVIVEEGRQTIVRAIEHEGVEELGPKLPASRLAIGAPFNPDDVEADRRGLLTALAQVGYTHAEVRADMVTKMDGDTEAATVRFVATAGAQEHVGTMVVQNNIDTRSRVILRELPFKSGEPLNPDALLRGQSNIYRLGLFRSITVRPLEAPSEDGRRDIGVSVAEKPAGTMQWGGGYNTRDGFRGFAEIGHANLGGLARRLSLRGEFTLDPGNLSSKQYVGNLGYREPHIADTQWTFRANLLAQRSTRSVDQFSLERFAFIPAIERTLLPGLQAGFELQAEQSQVFDVAPDVLLFNPRDAGRLRTVSVGPFAVYDGRDDPFVPRRGVFDSLRVRFAPGWLGSDVPFMKLVGQHSQYIPLDDDLTFVYAVRGGWSRALEGNDEVPIRERFFLGGRTTVRGFGENVIGPEGTTIINALGRSQGGRNPLGGDMVLNLNSELRFPLLYGLGGSVFVDGGGVYLHDRPVTLNDFRRSAGLGVRYITPVGPLSLEYGFKLDRHTGESVGEVHFSIGNIF